VKLNTGESVEAERREALEGVLWRDLLGEGPGWPSRGEVMEEILGRGRIGVEIIASSP
jgi:hypothetical protein